MDDGEALYDVEKIQKKRVTVDGKEEFLVKWVSWFAARGLLVSSSCRKKLKPIIVFDSATLIC